MNRRVEPLSISGKPAKTTPGKIKPALRDEIFMRDGFQCRFVGPGGRRCASRKNLEIDHIVPRARGGTNEPGNLRLLCSAHNKLMAERHLGKEFMEIQLRKKHINTGVTSLGYIGVACLSKNVSVQAMPGAAWRITNSIRF